MAMKYTIEYLRTLIKFSESTKKYTMLSTSEQKRVTDFMAAGFFELDEEEYVLFTKKGTLLLSHLVSYFEQKGKALAII